MLDLLLLWMFFGEPRAVTCQATPSKDRPKQWDVYVISDEDKPKWYSERDSRKSALKDCDKILQEQEKRWKQERKEKTK